MTETDDRRRTDDRGTDDEEKRTVKDIDHTHPHTDRPFGSSGVYSRGGSPDDDETVPADPDAEGATDRAGTQDRHEDEGREDADGDDRSGQRRRVKDLDHTPPDDVGAQRTFQRGEETSVDRSGRRSDGRGGD